ncbi:unnamed protein product, partial [Ectocarpus sp. 12 AP-2014]
TECDTQHNYGSRHEWTSGGIANTRWERCEVIVQRCGVHRIIKALRNEHTRQSDTRRYSEHAVGALRIAAELAWVSTHNRQHQDVRQQREGKVKRSKERKY